MDSLFTLLRVVVAFAVVVGLLLVLNRKTRKWTSRSKSNSAVRVYARQALGQKTSVVVVDIDARRYVLGVAEGNVTVIDKRKAPESAAALFAAELGRADSDDNTGLADAPEAPTIGQRMPFVQSLSVSAKQMFGGKR
ncbi:flagellar biosynthetic protein FliO [Curtobacterium sp. MCBD17_040]|uniref:FliO/MopB family protein n=1 Tax=Curtobacterium sp. MCBD17_040 TaxID=2175674 RepID=UPI000DA80BCF|nr:flagellar biosynthetic protein FliO [Curtobacterium sp. MCBD17_040]WIB65588.1 flagellar biosynthetic protein FliO [Curtobacterium sp. MCBD17_040]